MYQEISEAIRMAPKHNNSLETSPYPTQKRCAMHQSDFTLQIPARSAREHCKLVPGSKNTTESAKQ